MDSGANFLPVAGLIPEVKTSLVNKMDVHAQLMANTSVVIEFVISFPIINPKRYQGLPTLKEKKKFVLVSSVASYKFQMSVGIGLK